jgi:hypothetical protein
LKADKLLLELEHLLEQSGYITRYERGTFRGNDCLLEGNKVVIINKNKPKESQVATLAKVIRKVEVDDMFIKPIVRKELNKIWDQIDSFQGEAETLDGDDL